jgi:hypothetical protein
MILYIKVTLLSGSKWKGITMNKFKIALLLFVLFACSLAYAQVNNGLPTEEQVDKLVVAAWKERSESIDVTFYLEWTRPPKPEEQIRLEVEESFKEDIAALGDNPHPILVERTKASMERNIQRRIKIQQFPRLIKKRIRISGHNQHTDSVIAEPGGVLEPNVPFEGTYVNVGNRHSQDFFSFDYNHKIKLATIKNESGWAKRDPAKFAYMPLGIPLIIRAGLGDNKGTQADPFYVPDANKIQEYSRTGILNISTEQFQVKIVPDPNNPQTRERIEFGLLRYPERDVIICDRKDYSRVYHAEFGIPTTGKIVYRRECSNFDSKGFPHNITEIQYDKDGNFVKKSVYRIINVDLNPSIPDEVFKFKPPDDYEVDDQRPPEKRPENVNYLRTEDVRKTLEEVNKAFEKRDLTALKEFLKHKSWRVRNLALGLITGVAEGEELKKIAESVKEDKKNEVREKAERILKRLQK